MSISNYIKGNVSGSKKNGNNNNNSLKRAIFWEGIFQRKFLSGIFLIKSFLPKSSLASQVRVRVRLGKGQVRLGLGQGQVRVRLGLGQGQVKVRLGLGQGQEWVRVSLVDGNGFKILKIPSSAGYNSQQLIVPL